ncbi:DNA primase [Parabacteroides sp. OttesenSCG-928-G07]|nr:DNA primase [Parabacteroides sp. OttesenSCG-928-G07]
MIDQPTIDRILDAANIVDVVSEFVTLRRRGVNYIGLCPFHEDKSPSFTVSPAKNICKCFACGEGGTAVHFIMKHEQISYYDALRYLAKKYNIEIQEREISEEERQIRGERESMLIVNSWAQEYFSKLLHENEEGRNVGLRYFIERGFREDIIRKFQLGYSLEQRDALYQTAIAAGYRKEYLEKTGLIIAYENGRVNDRFRGRVIFPVHTLSGKVVAFGGRILKKDEKTAKYVNSPESEIYHKSNELYGIYFAKQAIVKADRCFLVEGYTDVISMHQAGIENVVASSGTALTGGQIRLIKRFTNNISVIYDGDAAGIKAALRGIDLLLEEGINVKVLLLPGGEDPDSFARSHSATEFTDFIQNNETDFIRFKTNLLLDEAGNDPIKRSALISDIIRSVAIIPDNIARTVYIRECSKMLDVDERVILAEVNKLRLKKQEKQVVIPTTHTTATGEGLSDTPPPDFPFITTPVAGDDKHPYAPDNMPPPPSDDFPAEMEQGAATSGKAAGKVKRSPYEPYELVLMRYVVRYGERVIYDEEKTVPIIEDEKVVGQRIVHDPSLRRVASYIYDDLSSDDIFFTNPLCRQMLEEAAGRCGEEGFSCSRYFLSHPDPEISRLAANLISDKYQLSKYHTKFRTIEQEDERLEMIVSYGIFALKEAYVNSQIKEVHARLKEAQNTGDAEKAMSLLMELKQLNDLNSNLCKELGERIVLKM